MQKQTAQIRPPKYSNLRVGYVDGCYWCQYIILAELNMVITLVSKIRATRTIRIYILCIACIVLGEEEPRDGMLCKINEEKLYCE